MPKDERAKLDMKSRRCILLGYGTHVKGYRIYDMAKRRVLYSRDVKFDETEAGYEREDNGCQKKDLKETRVDIEVDSGISEEHCDELTGPTLRRSSRARQAPDFYGERATLAHEGVAEPSSFVEAVNRDVQHHWCDAMQKEIRSLEENEVWDLVERPVVRKVVGSKWVYKLKYDLDGNVERYKARLVAQGFSQKFGEDYDQTFSPVVRFESLRALMALAAKHELHLHQMDVTTAFLHGVLEDEVFMKQPKGYEKEGKENLVCKLKRSIYGLKQSPRCWNAALDKKLGQMGFVQTGGDPCLYMKSGDLAYIAVYVDDLVIAARDETVIGKIKIQLRECFDMKDMGHLHHFLGMKIVQDNRMSPSGLAKKHTRIVC